LIAWILASQLHVAPALAHVVHRSLLDELTAQQCVAESGRLVDN
jgi:hypothetical protein